MKECWALNKIHGTSSHISYNPSRDIENKVCFFAGGAKHENFINLFDKEQLLAKFEEGFGIVPATVYGEAYGGKLQGMSHTYGPDLKFIVFDVKVNDIWLDVPNAEQVAHALGLEFVDYVKISTDLNEIDAQRDADDPIAQRLGLGSKPREGIVLRPLVEMILPNGKRVIAKHKNAAFLERTNQPKVTDPAKLEVVKNAKVIANDWVTHQRLTHVLDKNLDITGIEHTSKLIKAMTDDILREGEGEIAVTKEVLSAIGSTTAILWKQYLQEQLRTKALA